jgi:gliding motility-associated-like protein
MASGLGVTGIQFNAGGWHEVTLTLEEIGCAGTVTDSVFIETPPDLSAFAVSAYPSSGCAPLTVLFSSEANPDEVAQGWTFSDGESSDADAPVHVFETPGTYGVEVTAVSTGNCPASIDFAVDSLVVVHPNPPVGFMATPQIVDITNPVVTLESLVDSLNTVTYFGSDGGSLNAANGQYVFDNGGTFQLIQTVVSPEGCVSTAIGEVVVNGTLFYAPTAFTPDGDGLNDVWLPVARGVSRYHARIWNRWGELVWSSQKAEEPWLGQSQSGTHFAPDGIYLWEVTYLDQIDYPHIERGTLMLAR